LQPSSPGCPWTGSAPSAQVIPWTPLTPNLIPPAPKLGPAPLPPGTPPCQANELQGAELGGQGATGHVLTSFVFVGTGPGSCYLDGTPSVGLLDPNSQIIAIKQQAPYKPTQQPGRTLVNPGPLPTPHSPINLGQAALTIDWVSHGEACPGAAAVVPVQVLVAIPGGGVVAIAINPQLVAFPCQGLGVGAFEGPYVPIQPGPPPPLPAISMQVPSTGRVGVGLPYLVTLTNDHAQALDLIALCPTYEEELFADPGKGTPPLGGKHIYALNCGPPGSIPAGASVTFQMVFLVPGDAARGTYRLVFMLGYWNAMTSYSQATVTLN
jgi:hypothetical protein